MGNEKGNAGGQSAVFSLLLTIISIIIAEAYLSNTKLATEKSPLRFSSLVSGFMQSKK
jgi:hypothetical protein